MDCTREEEVHVLDMKGFLLELFILAPKRFLL